MIRLLFSAVCSIERDAQLLANRIALLKQEEQKTWKKIDDTKKRTNEILTLKKRNEDRIQKVSEHYRNNHVNVTNRVSVLNVNLENLRLPGVEREPAHERPAKLLGKQDKAGREAKGAGGHLPVEARGGEAVQDDQAVERTEEEVPELQGRAGESHEESDC